MQKFKLKKHDAVRIIAGKHKGKEGTVEQINKKTLRVFVKAPGVFNLVHKKASQDGSDGGIIEKNASIHISNLALINPKNKKTITKIGYKIKSNGEKIRIARSTNTEIHK